MKKSQILAALALAFALGVVAPVAGIYTDGSASAFDAKADTATGTDVQNSINSAENKETYKRFKALYNVLNGFLPNYFPGELKATDDPIYADYKNDLAGKAVAAVWNVSGIFNQLSTNGGLNIDGVIANTPAATIAQTKNVVSKISADSDYTIYADLYDAIEDENLADLRTAVHNYNISSLNTYEPLTDVSSDSTFGQLKSKVESLTSWTNAKALVKAVEAADENVKMYENGIRAFDSATAGILTGTGKATVDRIKDAATVTDTNPVKLSDLAAVINNGGTYQNSNFTISLTNWNNVRTALKNASPYDDGDTRANYNKIKAIVEAYKAAANDGTALETLMAQFAAYKTPDTPAGDDQNDDNTTVRPGNTGIVAGAEGTASTTVSIVAGLATALTALGAGVVVYRNARRSSEN